MPNLPGAHTYAETIDELQTRLVEVISLCEEELENPYSVTTGHGSF